MYCIHANNSYGKVFTLRLENQYSNIKLIYTSCEQGFCNLSVMAYYTHGWCSSAPMWAFSELQEAVF